MAEKRLIIQVRTLRFDLLVGHVIVESQMTINHSFGGKFEHPVAHRLCKRMVMCGQKHRAFVVFKALLKAVIDSKSK